MKKLPIFTGAFLCLLLCLSCRSGPASRKAAASDISTTGEDNAFDVFPDVELPSLNQALAVSEFPEIWTYVLAGREAALKKGLPLSDIGYFGADVDSYGKLIDVPVRKKLPPFSGRVHLVAACSGRALTHFVLIPGSAERKALIADLLAAAKDYDGLQIDFENVPKQDGEAFISFLSELRSGLGRKMFTVALPAHIRKISGDVYDYERIAPLVDRILVMAYDEHWSTSSPGPIASLPWCKKVAEYALKAVGKEKLIMGLPFYGRAWGSPSHSQALVYTGIERVMNENKVTEIKRENGIPYFDYKATIAVKVYYDDDYSLSARMEMYRTMGVTAIGFWRLGQEIPAVWNILKLAK